jgi:phosphoadenosine phosphosulfate reductase
MPLETVPAPVAERVQHLNQQFQGQSAMSVLSHALSDVEIGRVALVSSFGADSVVLLHMVSVLDRSTPILFIDTELLFAETLDYQSQLAETLKLTDIRVLKADRAAMFARDPDGLLRHFEPDACCALRKVEPLQKGLSGFDGWITGRKRSQGGKRQQTNFFEDDAGQRIKINPLAYWSPADLSAYIGKHKLPSHPLVAKGFLSLGCLPCTSPVHAGEDIRAGRWRGRAKDECGIHFTPEGIERREAVL